ncbi:MAG: PAS domain S-box protein [Gammaproteobacteria bacterium]|nr:PAS domain S-box protein [Gammaproteobacteria bacterium]
MNQPSVTLFSLFIIGFLLVVLITWVLKKKLPTSCTTKDNQIVQHDLSEITSELEHVRRYHRQILLDLPLGVCAINDSDEITMWNQALEEITGISNVDVSDKKLTELNEPWLSLLHNFRASGYAHLYKQSFELAGKKRTVNLHKSVIEESTDSDLSHGGTLILLADITETEILEAGLSHSERLASIGRLAAGVAHEIGNPITAIACLAQNIRDEYKDEELRTMAEQIIEQTNRISRIVQSLVNFAHAGTQKPNADSEVITIIDCINEAITLVSLDKKGKSINYEIQCAPEFKIMGDSQRMLQVMLNLINNARDASQPGSTITLRCESRDDAIQITVEDGGIGIPPAIRDRVFDPFFTTKEAGDGTGLGLSLVFSIVEDLHGNIDIISPIKSKPNRGTRVILSFPHNRMNPLSTQAAAGFDPDKPASTFQISD